MKKINSFYNLVILYSLVLCSCTSEKTNRVYFNIDPLNRTILIPVKVNDSITANLAFDTGAKNLGLDLDSTLCANNSSILTNYDPDTLVNSGSAWAAKGFIASIYKFAPKISIDTTSLNYDYMRIYNWKKYFNNLKADGLFNIPKSDSTNVWELNFENNYLEIHNPSNFKMPKDCFVYPLIRYNNSPYPFYVSLPIKIECSDGDTLNLKRLFMIDTGMPQDIAIMSKAPELSFFNNKKNAVWTVDGYNYKRYYTVSSTISDFKIDSLRIYTFTFPNSVFCDYVIGQNFLKHFNVFFDLKNNQIGLQALKNYKRLINPGHRRFHYSTYQSPEGKTIVKYVANYEKNYYKTAGLRAGDEIIKVNGKNYNEYSRSEIREFYTLEKIIFDVIRDGNPLKIEVLVDKNEKQGD